MRRRPRDRERDPTVDGVAGYMLDDEGFVLPRFRHHVAALRKTPEMCNIGEAVHAATSQSRNAEE